MECSVFIKEWENYSSIIKHFNFRTFSICLTYSCKIKIIRLSNCQHIKQRFKIIRLISCVFNITCCISNTFTCLNSFKRFYFYIYTSIFIKVCFLCSHRQRCCCKITGPVQTKVCIERII